MRGESGVNVSRFSAPLVGSYGESCVAEKTKRGRDKKTKRLRDKETKGLRDEESKRQRDEERKRRRDKKTKRGRGKETKGQRDEGTKGQEDENHVTSYSCPLHLLFTSSLPLNSFNSCTKTFARFVSKTVLHQRTPLRESSVKVRAGGTGREKAQ